MTRYFFVVLQSFFGEEINQQQLRNGNGRGDDKPFKRSLRVRIYVQTTLHVYGCPFECGTYKEIPRQCRWIQIRTQHQYVC